jgi:hypothetical protein
LIGGSSQPKRSSQPFMPYQTNNLWGGVSIDYKNRTANQYLSDFASRVAGEGEQGVLDTFGGAFQQRNQGRNLAQMGADDYGFGYGALQSYGMPSEALFSGAMNQMGQYGNLFGNLAQASAQNPYARQQMALGTQFMGAQPQSYDSVAQQRLGLLRDQAAPFEDRAFNSLQNKMFSQGRMGSTGGGRDMEAFARGLGQADTARQLDSMGFAEQLYGRDQQYAQAQQAMGANLFSGGASNWMQGQQMAGQLGQLGLGAAGGQYDLGMNWNQAGYTRAQDRMNRAQQMFGFGNTLQVQPAANVDPWLKLLSGITGEQGNMMNASAALGGGGQSISPGDTTGQSVGSFLGGLGQGMMTGNIDVGGMADAWRMRGLSPIDITAKRM